MATQNAEVIELRRPIGRKKTTADARTRAVTLALSHAGFVRVLELIKQITLRGGGGYKDEIVEEYEELVGTVMSSISGGDGPALQDALTEMAAAWRAEVDEEERARAERQASLSDVRTQLAAPRAHLRVRDGGPSEQPSGLSIGELYGLSVRTYNCLQRAGVLTIADLLRAREQGLEYLKGIGNKSCEEIESALTHARNLRAVGA